MYDPTQTSVMTQNCLRTLEVCNITNCDRKINDVFWWGGNTSM